MSTYWNEKPNNNGKSQILHYSVTLVGRIIMKKITYGRKRTADRGISHALFGNILFVLGTVSLCAMLALSGNSMTEKVKFHNLTEDAVSVGAFREELETVEKPVFSPERSFFDSLGEFFAELIFGER